MLIMMARNLYKRFVDELMDEKEWRGDIREHTHTHTSLLMLLLYNNENKRKATDACSIFFDCLMCLNLISINQN